MTTAQIIAVDGLLQDLAFLGIHHGDCIGADADVDRIAIANGLRRVAHPPVESRLRAFCDADEILEPKPYLERDRDIVASCDHLIATPRESERRTRGGTWYTIRFAEDAVRKVTIVWPNGTTS